MGITLNLAQMGVSCPARGGVQPPGHDSAAFKNRKNNYLLAHAAVPLVNVDAELQGGDNIVCYESETDRRARTYRTNVINTFELMAILYWQWRQRRAVHRMLVRWLSRTTMNARGRADTIAGFYDMTYRNEGGDRGPKYDRGKAEVRSSAASLLATARRCAGRLYEEWRIPHPWLQATVAEHLRGGVPVRACPRGARQRGTVAPEPRSRARQGAGGNRSATPGGEAQSESTPSDWALRVAGQGAMSMPSACATPPFEPFATVHVCCCSAGIVRSAASRTRSQCTSAHGGVCLAAPVRLS
jgi:hypothetical protein